MEQSYHFARAHGKSGMVYFCLIILLALPNVFQLFQILPYQQSLPDQEDLPSNSSIVSQATVVILVLSARSHFDRRKAIRETWGKGHDNVYFVVGSANQPPPSEERNTSTAADPHAALTLTPFQADFQKEYDLLKQEIEAFRDIIIAPRIESYHSLPNKIKYGYDFVLRHFPQIQWIVKADDDFYVRVKPLAEFLQTLNATIPTIVGRMLWWGDPVHKSGKWAEHHYKKTRYPVFPIGSYGHAVSRSIAEYVALYKERLFEYQGEDTSLGIWIDESPIKPLWAKAGEDLKEHQLLWKTLLKQRGFSFEWTDLPIRFHGNGKCENKSLYMIGHEITPAKMRQCFDAE